MLPWLSYWRFLALFLAYMRFENTYSMNSVNRITRPINFSCNVWRSIDDTVMGGMSSSRTTWSDELVAWIMKGQVRLENNGGFASSRLALNINMNEFDGIYLDATAMANEIDSPRIEFSLTLKDLQAAQTQVNFKGSFLAGEMGTFSRSYLLFSELIPEYRGRQLDRQPLEKGKIVELGIMAKQPNVVGNFELRIQEIGGFKEQPTRA